MKDANHYWLVALPAAHQWGNLGDMGGLIINLISGSSRYVCLATVWGRGLGVPPLGVCVIRLLWG